MYPGLLIPTRSQTNVSIMSLLELSEACHENSLDEICFFERGTQRHQYDVGRAVIPMQQYGWCRRTVSLKAQVLGQRNARGREDDERHA